RPVLLGEHLRADTRAAHGEELSADVDEASEVALLALQLPLPARHPVEHRACQPPARPLDEAQVLGERPELRVARGKMATTEGELRQPARVEAPGVRRRLGLGTHVRLLVAEGAGHLQMLVDLLTRDETTHDLRRA